MPGALAGFDLNLHRRRHHLEGIGEGARLHRQGEEPRRQEGFAMNNRFMVAAVAFLLLLFQFSRGNAAGTGPYDGEWKGTATSAGERCKRAAVAFTVEGQVVLGQAKFDGDTSSINGTVSEGGAVGATIGFQFLTGRFSGEEFEGTFKFSDCQWEAVLKRTSTSAGDRNRAATSGLKGR
jgi:hypothetical protein